MKTMRRGLGLVLAGGLLWACQPQAGAPAGDGPGGFDAGAAASGDMEVARVDGSVIYQSDVERAAAAQGLVPEGTPLVPGQPVFQVTLEELVDQRLLALDAFRRGLDQSPEARRRLSVARERILGNLNVEAALAERVTESELRALYDAQNALVGQDPERRVQQIVLADRAGAEAAAARLSDGEDFAEVARELSVDTASREAGGDLGWVTPDALPDALADAVFAAPVGARLDPVEIGGRWFVAEVVDARTPGARPFEDVREDLERFLTFQTVEDLLEGLRGEAQVSYSVVPGAANGGVDADSGGEP